MIELSVHGAGAARDRVPRGCLETGAAIAPFFGSFLFDARAKRKRRLTKAIRRLWLTVPKM
ncbi:MAG: hypothetical protein EOP23_09865 [Hyphomicrobiales bacterium]|nr:MAG: hypothetical protein EOP23_09865 [Hyphomicrobiales bacterium]